MAGWQQLPELTPSPRNVLQSVSLLCLTLLCNLNYLQLRSPAVTQLCPLFCKTLQSCLWNLNSPRTYNFPAPFPQKFMRIMRRIEILPGNKSIFFLFLSIGKNTLGMFIMFLKANFSALWSTHLLLHYWFIFKWLSRFRLKTCFLE